MESASLFNDIVFSFFKYKIINPEAHHEYEEFFKD